MKSTNSQKYFIIFVQICMNCTQDSQTSRNLNEKKTHAFTMFTTSAVQICSLHSKFESQTASF